VMSTEEAFPVAHSCAEVLSMVREALAPSEPHPFKIGLGVPNVQIHDFDPPMEKLVIEDKGYIAGVINPTERLHVKGTISAGVGTTKPKNSLHIGNNLASMKYKIELSKEQMRLIAQCLEDCSRFASGQWQMQNTVEAMVIGLPFDEQIKRRDDAEELLRQAKNTLLSNMPDNGSFSYNGTPFIGNTYQIYRTILYQLAQDENWDNVYSSPALPSGNLGIIKVERTLN
jgi:hypothetical protein